MGDPPAHIDPSAPPHRLGPWTALRAAHPHLAGAAGTGAVMAAAVLGWQVATPAGPVPVAAQVAASFGFFAAAWLPCSWLLAPRSTDDGR